MEQKLFGLASAIETINQMRHCIPGLVSTPPDSAMLNSLWALAHSFTERLHFLGNRPLSQFAAAFDLLMADLNDMPEQLNPSTLRTVPYATLCDPPDGPLPL